MARYNAKQLHDLFLRANPDLDGFTAWTAAAVALAESKGDPNARNPRTGEYTTGKMAGTHDEGLWQINTSHAGATFDPLGNARAAGAIYRQSGWFAWATMYSPGHAFDSRYYGKLDSPVAKIIDADWFKKITAGSSGGTTIGGIGGVAHADANAAKGVVNDVAGWTVSLGKLLANLLNGQWWKRVGQGAAGLLLLLIGAGLLFRKDAAAIIKPAAKVAMA